MPLVPTSIFETEPTLISALLAVLAASLAGSLHCVAMCGPIALLARGTAGWHAALYHGGRLFGYLLLGILAGAFGRGILNATLMGRLQLVFAALLGGLLIWTGALWMRPPSAKVADKNSALNRGQVLGWAHALLRRGYQRVAPWPAPARNAVIGLLSVLLPCGWLYGFVLASMATASAAAGAAVLTVFWLGTVPVFAVGTALTRLRVLQKLDRVWFRRAVGLLMIALGLHSIQLHLSARPALSVETVPVSCH